MRCAASIPRVCSTTSWNGDWCASPAGRMLRAARSCSRPRASSRWRSASRTSTICPRSKAISCCPTSPRVRTARARRSPVMPKLRLNKILAQAGRTSRRGGDRLILEGRVAVNGTVTREPGTLADPASDVVTVDGRPLAAREPLHYVLLNKPPGFVTTRHDPRGRAVVTDLVHAPVRLYPVGRLDYDVEGLLLLTNDGALTHRLLHPRYRVVRVYEACVEGRVSPADLPRWRQGAMLEDGRARPTSVELVHSGSHQSVLRIGFAEGRKHEVKRFAEALGHRIVGLRRVAFGPVQLGSLPRGRSRPLTSAEIRALRAAVAETAPR